MHINVKNLGIRELRKAIRELEQDKFEQIWISANKKLYVFKNDKFIQVKNEKISNIHIRKIFTDQNNLIYLATLHRGLFVYKDNKW